MSQDFRLLVFLHESVSPKPLSIPLGLFRIFRKFAEIYAAQGDTGGKFATGINNTNETGGATGVVDTGGTP